MSYEKYISPSSYVGGRCYSSTVGIEGNIPKLGQET